MGNTPTIGVIGAPGLDELLRAVGFRVVGGTEPRPSATAISDEAMGADGPFPIVVTDSAEFTILRQWVAAMSARTAIVVLKTSTATGMLEGRPEVLSLPATFNDVLTRLGYEVTSRDIGSQVLDPNAAATTPPGIEPTPQPDAADSLPELEDASAAAAAAKSQSAADLFDDAPASPAAASASSAAAAESFFDDESDDEPSAVAVPPIFVEPAAAHDEAPVEIPSPIMPPPQAPSVEDFFEPEDELPDPLQAQFPSGSSGTSAPLLPEALPAGLAPDSMPAMPVEPTARAESSARVPVTLSVEDFFEPDEPALVPPAQVDSRPALETAEPPVLRRARIREAPRDEPEAASRPIEPAAQADGLQYEPPVETTAIGPPPSADPAAEVPFIDNPFAPTGFRTEPNRYVPEPDWDETHHRGSPDERMTQLPPPVGPEAPEPVPSPPVTMPAPSPVPASALTESPAMSPAIAVPRAQSPAPAPIPATAHAAAYPPPGFSGSGPRATTVLVAAGKGGVGKTTSAIMLAELAARRGLRAVLVDTNRGQADVRKYLKLSSAALPTVLDGVQDPQAAILMPAQFAAARQQLRLDGLNFAVALGPPPDYAAPAYVPAWAYSRVIATAQMMADIVIVDTQIIEAARTDLWNEMLIPLLLSGGWLVGITDASSPGVSNLADRLAELGNAGVSSARTLVVASGHAVFTEDDSTFFQSRFARLGAFAGATGDDPRFAEDMDFGRINGSPLVDPVMNAILDRVLGVPAVRESFATPAEQPEPKRKRWGRR